MGQEMVGACCTPFTLLVIRVLTGYGRVMLTHHNHPVMG